MSISYPQEVLGTTLLQTEHAGERRRVFACDRGRYLEVGEFTQGPHTREIYKRAAHYHAIHLSGGDVCAYEEFFSSGDPFLTDFMDMLDERHVRYGYMDTTANGHVSYRPA